MTKKAKQPAAKVLSTYELMQKFPNEQAAIEYLKPILWREGPVCPYCKGDRIKPRKNKPNYYNCVDCRKDFTIRTGTIFERSHIQLHKWLYAMYLLVTSRKGISSVQLSKEIGVTQRSAWFLEQRIRAACGNNEVKMILPGIVEVDEAYFGGKESSKHESKKLHQGRGTVGKTPVVGLRDRDGNVYAQVVTSTDKATLQGIVMNNVTNQSIVCTDENQSYNGLNAFFIHKTVNHSAKQFVDGMAHTNGIESVWALLKRGFYGIFHSFSEKHTQLYVDEFAFRLNEGKCSIDTVDRLDSLLRRTSGIRLTYKMLKGGV